MRKLFYNLFMAVSLLLGTAACSGEEELIPSGSNEGVEVSFKIALDGAVPSRALNNNPDDDVYATGKTVDNVIAAVYSGGEEIEALRKPTNTINDDLTCNITFRLIEGQTYDFVFWAEKNGTYYDKETFPAINIDYSNVKSNDESRDAFTAVRKGLVVKNGGVSETIVLTRPFAQLNIASTDEDHKVAEAAGFGCDVLSSKVIVKGVYTSYNIYTEALDDSKDVVFDLAKVPGAAGEVLKNVKSKTDAETNNYTGYLAMNYFLASKESSQNVDVVARFKSSKSETPVEISVPNVPVQRNYRTNIIGNILTEQTIFNIIIDPNFYVPDYVVNPEDEPTAIVSSTETQTLSTGVYVMEDGVDVTATSGHAVALKEGADVTIIVNGNVTLTGATNGDGIYVPAGSSLKVTGSGNLTVVGNNGAEDEKTEDGGSGIGVDGNGSVTVVGMKNMTAKGYGIHGFGIGGDEATVCISGSTIDYVCGGFIQPNLIKDTKYGKTELEGGPAIGGKEIVLTNAVVTKADGGSKAAGIGAKFWQSTEITIENSTIKEVNGGNASAGIGGSRFSGGISAENKQSIKIAIKNSTITATGGEYGPGIGAGYDTHCAANETNAVNDIQIETSVITAKGGKYAAGIGTGYHSAALTGSIDAASTITATAGDETFYKDTYTTAQAIGYGVVDPAREYKDAKVTFTVAGKVIEAPTVQQ